LLGANVVEGVEVKLSVDASSDTRRAAIPVVRQKSRRVYLNLNEHQNCIYSLMMKMSMMKMRLRINGVVTVGDEGGVLPFSSF
jgi:hypothetical protein